MSSEKQKLFEEFWEWRMKEFPEFATFCGNHQYDHLLNDHTEEAYLRREKTASSFLDRIEHLSAGDSDCVSTERLIDDLKVFLNGVKYKSYVFVIAYLEGMQTDFEQLTSWMKFDNIDDYRKYVQRLNALPIRLSQDENSLRLGIMEGKTLHSVSMETVCEQIKAYNDHPEKTVFYEPFLRVPDSISQEEIKTVRKEAINVIGKSVIPAFMKLKDFLERDYIPNCRKQEGVLCLPNGLDFYQACLDWHLSLHMTPQQVHDLGMKEITKLKKKMIQVMESVDFNGSIREFVELLRKDKRFQFDSKQAALEEYKKMCSEKIRPMLNKLFHKIPQSDMIIEAAPESRPNAPIGYYLAGTLDGSRPGKYYINITNLQDK